ncbi:MAG: DUF192 domain-containing protein [Candidatus Taylorbacteria bacterium]|nr:DUF192 domain-containing protein [Candidatus Taylorbacteria bacterium]
MMHKKLITVGIIFIAGVLFLNAFPPVSAPPIHGPKLTTPTGTEISLFIADTDAEREKGLGGRDSLGADEGMLFIFPETSVHPFWMKGMRFPLDMIWLSDEMEVVHLETDVAVDTYPALFGQGIQARYVLELSAGMAEKSGITLGNVLSLE